jgi:hypothetical protein
MHERGGLRQGALRQRFEQPIQHVALGRRDLQPEVAAQEPLRHEFHFAHQQGAAITRQIARHGVVGRLHGAKRAESIRVQPIRRLVGAKLIEVLPPTQVRQQQQAALRILCQHHRRVQAHPEQYLRHVQERSETLLLGRRVHHDVGVLTAGDAKIAAETRIDGRGLDPAAGESEIVEHPSSQIRQAGIACIR